MNRRITQGDIARVAGVHHTTVSLALRNSRLIPVDTRKRIQGVAQQLGYFPDPALRALAVYRNSRGARRELGTLAYVTNWETKWGWQSDPVQAQYHAGTQRKAIEIGYQLEHFWLGEAGMTPRRLGDMLLHRGIVGVILASHRPEGDDLADIDWSRLAVMKIGHRPATPAAARVDEDRGDRLRLALRHARAAGYRRPGFVLATECHEHDDADCAWFTAIVTEQSRLHPADRVPAFRLPPGDLTESAQPFLPTQDVSASQLADWHDEHRPDVILGLGPRVIDCLGQAGLAVPDDIPYIDLSLDRTDGQVAGVLPNCDRIGALAVEMLSIQILQNNLGLPTLPIVTTVGGTWCPGGSLPAASDLRRSRMVAGASSRCA